MKKETRKRADQRSGLDIGQMVKPVEKALNGLANGAYEREKGIARNQKTDIGLAEKVV